MIKHKKTQDSSIQQLYALNEELLHIHATDSSIFSDFQKVFSRIMLGKAPHLMRLQDGIKKNTRQLFHSLGNESIFRLEILQQKAYSKKKMLGGLSHD